MSGFHVIVNPSSGGDRTARTAGPVVTAPRQVGAQVRVTISPGPEAADDLVGATVGAGERCIAVGAIGMVSSIAGPAHAYSACLGIVPPGRGNDFAHQLGVPHDRVRLAASFLVSDPTPVDAIQVAGRVAMGSVYAGVDSRTSQIVNGLRRMPAPLQYPYRAARALATFPRTSYRVVVDGTVHEYDGFTVVAANSGYYGSGMHIAPATDVQDGLLDVVMLAPGNRGGSSHGCRACIAARTSITRRSPSRAGVS